MTLHVNAIAVDCANALTVARFWSSALDEPLDEGATEEFASIGVGTADRRDPAWMFTQVPEQKAAKNRLHIDLDSGGDRAAAVARLAELGATHIADKAEWGHAWSVLADPEGNEFCVA